MRDLRHRSTALYAFGHRIKRIEPTANEVIQFADNLNITSYSVESNEDRTDSPYETTLVEAMAT